MVHFFEIYFFLRRRYNGIIRDTGMGTQDKGRLPDIPGKTETVRLFFPVSRTAVSRAVKTLADIPAVIPQAFAKKRQEVRILRERHKGKQKKGLVNLNRFRLCRQYVS